MRVAALTTRRRAVRNRASIPPIRPFDGDGSSSYPVAPLNTCYSPSSCWQRWCCVRPAYDLLNGQGLTNTFKRPVGYPLLVAAVFSSFGPNLMAVAAVQHAF